MPYPAGFQQMMLPHAGGRLSCSSGMPPVGGLSTLVNQSINSFAARTSYALLANRPAFNPVQTRNFSDAAGLNAALAVAQAGDRLKNVNTTGGYTITSEFTGFANKNFASTVEIDLLSAAATIDPVTMKVTDPNAIKFVGNQAQLPAVFIYNSSNLRIYGGDITGVYDGIRINGSQSGGGALTKNVTWWNFYIHDTPEMGIKIYPLDWSGGSTNTIQDCDFMGEVANWGTNWNFDTHATLGSGLHACNLADINNIGNLLRNKVAIYAHDGNAGAGIEIGQDGGGSIVGNTIILKAVNCTFPNGASGGNALNVWGNVAQNTVAQYVEATNCAQSALLTAGTHPGFIVAFGRAVNCGPVPWSQVGQITYQDVI